MEYIPYQQTHFNYLLCKYLELACLLACLLANKIIGMAKSIDHFFYKNIRCM